MDPYPSEVVLAKAIDLCGGLDNLAYVLDRRVEELCRWIAGTETVPEDVMREAVVLITSVRK